MGRKKVWTPNEDRFIIENAGKMKDKELAELMSETFLRKITVQAVRKERQKLNVLKSPGRGKCQVRPTQSIPVTGLVINNDVVPVVVDNKVDGDESTPIVINEDRPFLFTP